MNDVDSLILAGGRSTRLGGMDKAEIRVAGERLVDRVVGAARSVVAGKVIVVGSASAGSTADEVLRESPEFSGPLAAIAAGIKRVDAPWVLILSCDLQYPQEICHALASFNLSPDSDGVALIDAEQHTQWLAGIYRTEALNNACAALGEKVVNGAVRAAFTQLSLEFAQISTEISADIDTPQALDEARRRLEH